MSYESMLQALESTADQIDRLAHIIDECLTLVDSGVPMSATTRQKMRRRWTPYASSGRSCYGAKGWSRMGSSPSMGSSFRPCQRWPRRILRPFREDHANQL